MSKRLLITGAKGFTGRHLVGLAQRAGFEVFSLRADLNDFIPLRDEVVTISPTYVIHLAAISAVTHSDQNAFYRVNLFGSLNLLEALKCSQQQPQMVLLASSANVYGNRDIELIEESACPKPVNHYAMSKLAMEHMAMTYGNYLPIVITRPFNYTGVGQDNRFVIPKIVEHFKSGANVIELGNIDVYREYNDVRMLCDSYLRLITMGVSGQIYNVCSGRIYSLREIIAAVEKITGRKIDIRVNQAYVRSNEVRKLAGSPAKLSATVGGVKIVELEETLEWMLSST